MVTRLSPCIPHQKRHSRLFGLIGAIRAQAHQDGFMVAPDAGVLCLNPHQKPKSHGHSSNPFGRGRRIVDCVYNGDAWFLQKPFLNIVVLNAFNVFGCCGGGHQKPTNQDKSCHLKSSSFVQSVVDTMRAALALSSGGGVPLCSIALRCACRASRPFVERDACMSDFDLPRMRNWDASALDAYAGACLSHWGARAFGEFINRDLITEVARS